MLYTGKRKWIKFDVFLRRITVRTNMKLDEEQNEVGYFPISKTPLSFARILDGHVLTTQGFQNDKL